MDRARKPDRRRWDRHRTRPAMRATTTRWWLPVAAVAAAALVCSLLLAPARMPGWWSRRDQGLTAQAARESNAAVPIESGELRPARRFVFRGTPAGHEQAVTCLATAALYEAGRDARSQKAVIQVVLNRVRLPGFPRTVCGVVYQGADRGTGCQFSFVCDGSVSRRPERAGWLQARRLALRALAGYVFAPVGRASHYHADWMVPYWRPSLAKVAQIGPHIFYLKRCRSCGSR